MLEKNPQVKAIAEMYGLKSQMGVCQEECAELIQAISKWYRDKADMDNLYEEIADVEIMLEQLKHLLNCRLEVDMWQSRKIARTLERGK